jgi:hypothetical protein
MMQLKNIGCWTFVAKDEKPDTELESLFLQQAKAAGFLRFRTQQRNLPRNDPRPVVVYGAREGPGGH